MKIVLFLFFCGTSSIAARSVEDDPECTSESLVEISSPEISTLEYYFRTCAEKSNTLTSKDVTAIASNAFVNSTLEDLTLVFADELHLEPESFNGMMKLRKISIKSAIVSPDKEKVFEPIKNLQSLEFRINATNETLVENIPKVLASLTELKIFNSTIKSIGVANSSCKSCSTISTLSVTKSKISWLEPKAFASFPSLKELYLSENSLRSLQPETFDGLDKLEYLDVHGNDLITISRNLFTKLKSLKLVNLMGKNLTTIKEGTFDGVRVI